MVSDDSCQSDISYSRCYSIFGMGDVGKKLISELEEYHPKDIEQFTLKHFSAPCPDPKKPFAAGASKGDLIDDEGEHDNGNGRGRNAGLDEQGQEPVGHEEEKGFFTRIKESLFGAEEEPEEEFEIPKKTDPDESDRNEAYREHMNYIRSIHSSIKEFDEKDILLIFTDLSDKQAIQNTIDLCRLCKEQGVFTIVSVFLPLKLGNVNLIDPMDRKLQELRLQAEVVVMLPNYILLKHKGVNSYVFELLELVDQSGIVNLDLADMKQVVKGGNVGVVGVGTSQYMDEERVQAAFKRALRHPLFRIDILSASKLLINMFGSNDMSLQEAEKGAEEVQMLVRTKTRIIWGATVDEKYSKRIKIFLMVGVKPREVLVHLYANAG